MHAKGPSFSPSYLDQAGHDGARIAAGFILNLCSQVDDLPHHVALEVRRGRHDHVASFHKFVAELLCDGCNVRLLQRGHAK